MNASAPTPADAVAGHWTIRVLPPALHPYASLARWDRPIGWWLLMWPCWWSAALAAIRAGDPLPNLWHLILFMIGAIAMRGAGCTYNDIVDREIDANVARTRNRPIPSGAITVRNAKIFMVAQSLVGLIVLLQFNLFAIGLGIASLAVVAVYPFMKRITSWPQAVLGLAFSWGALMGWAGAFGRLDWPPVLLYVGGICWTIAYDTIYAHQDREDDAIIGVKSTARLFAHNTKLWISILFAAALALFLAAGLTAGAGPWLALFMLLPAAHIVWQVRTLKIGDSDTCLMLFRSNEKFGWLMMAALVAAALLNAWR